MAENKVEAKQESPKEYSIKIIDTYIDKNTGNLAKNFGKVYKVPQDIKKERAEELINAKVAKVVSK